MNEQRLADLLAQRDNAFAYGREMGHRAAENYLAWPQIETIANAPAAQVAAMVQEGHYTPRRATLWADADRWVR